MADIAQSQHDQLLAVLSRYVSGATAISILKFSIDRADKAAGPQAKLDGVFITAVASGLELFGADPKLRERCLHELQSALHPPAPRTVLAAAQLRVDNEEDIVRARLAARAFAKRLGFGETDQSKITTAVSELARNIHRYAGRGSIDLACLSPPREGMSIVAEDRGPGIANLSTILAGGYKSRTGLGLGILGCKRLMDEFAIESAPNRGTRVAIAKYLRRTS